MQAAAAHHKSPPSHAQTDLSAALRTLVLKELNEPLLRKRKDRDQIVSLAMQRARQYASGMIDGKSLDAIFRASKAYYEGFATADNNQILVNGRLNLKMSRDARVQEQLRDYLATFVLCKAVRALDKVRGNNEVKTAEAPTRTWRASSVDSKTFEDAMSDSDGPIDGEAAGNPDTFVMRAETDTRELRKHATKTCTTAGENSP